MDVYRMNNPTDYDSDSSNDEVIHKLPDSSGGDGDDMDLLDFQEHTPSQPQHSASIPQSRRPPAIATSWNDSMDSAAGVEVRDDHNAPTSRFSSLSTTHNQYEDEYPVQSINKSYKTPAPTKSMSTTPSTEETPAFIRQYARDVMKIADNNLASSPTHHASMVPPNSLLGVQREKTTKYSQHTNNQPYYAQDNSFVGADASGLDSTFVSIRDLNDDDDDVPSINNDQSYAKFDGTFPTERTSLLNHMAWRGGLFFPQVEKEDRKDRRKMVRENKGWVAGLIWSVGSVLKELWEDNTSVVDDGRNRMSWDASHPIGEEMPVRSYGRGSSSRNRPIFSTVLSGLLCFHILLCALHDLFVRYVSYRNEDEVGVSWDGEGAYSPPYWLSFEGRVLNPLIGPGSRTLTAFGAIVPGLVLSKGQWWRVPLALVESSSVLELLLHFLVIKTALGGSVHGLECKRGTFAVSLSYVITATIGSVWSMATDKERLVTSSGMGVTGLLAVFITEQFWFPPLNKQEDDEQQSHSVSHNDLGGGHNVVSSSANESFSFQPMQPKKERNLPIKGISPSLLLATEIIVSWWAPYQSLGGTMAAAGMGLALALIMFVGISPEHPLDNSQDLIFHETPPPPPSSAAPWRDDDDSADSSFGSGRQPFTSPVMRKSILGEEDEDETYGPKSYLRKRKTNGSETNTTPARYISMHPNKQYHSTLPILWRIIGIFIALLLTLLPAVLLAVAQDPSYETIRASILGCKPMVIVYRLNNDDNNVFQCAGCCVPLSRTNMAKKKEMMKNGRCDAIGYRCLDDAGTMILGKYELDVGLYSVPLSDGSCASTDDAAAQQQEVANDDEANNEAA
eukprot:scaffold35457_cov62-Cyclotella_meneghiniana.AAC.4